MTTLTVISRRARTIGRVALIGATLATAACGNLPTAPAAPASATAAPADGALRASGYMLSSGRGER
jgi:hypothetical protein